MNMLTKYQKTQRGSHEVVNMNRRMMGQEKSLNDPVKAGEAEEWQDWLVDDSLDQELIISQKQEFDDKKELLYEFMNILNDRKKEILKSRRLAENPKTLEELSKNIKLAEKEYDKLKQELLKNYKKSMINSRNSKNLLPAN